MTNHDDQTRNRIATVTKLVGVVLMSLGALLPAGLLSRFNTGRKAVIAAAGSLLSVAASLDTLNLTGTLSMWLGYATAAATAIVTYWVPNHNDDATS